MLRATWAPAKDDHDGMGVVLPALREAMLAMSLHRRAAKRDANEPAIVSALEALGCVVWRVSGKGLPDLIVLRAGKKWLADVKAAKKGVTEPQAELWEKAATKARCAVFILRTPEDAQKMLNNALQPWEPAPWCQNPGCIHRGPCPEAKRPRNGDAEKAGGMSVPRNGRDAKKACGCLRSLGRCEHSGSYTPPRSTPVDAAKPVRGLGSEMMAEMLKPPGDENYENALGRALTNCCGLYETVGEHDFTCDHFVDA